MDNNSEKPWWHAGMVVFAEVTGWIVAPIIGALYLGRYLDEINNSEPWYFLSLTGVAFVISTIGITITAGKYISKIEKESKLTSGKAGSVPAGNKQLKKEINNDKNESE